MADVTLAGVLRAPRQTRWERYTTVSRTGGMGFRYDTGVISVEAQADRIRVTADRLIVYEGAHTHRPPGSDYDIGTPSVTADGLALDVPLTVTPLQPVNVVVEPLAATVQDRTALDVTVLDRTQLTVIVED